MSVNYGAHLGFRDTEALLATLPEPLKSGAQHAFEAMGAAPYPVEINHIPALRAIIKHQFPKASIHQRAKLEANVAPILGAKMRSYLKGNESMSAYANAIKLASDDPNLKKALDVFANLSIRKEVEGSQGFGTWPSTEGKNVGGKETLSAHFIQASTESFDTPVAVKVESTVNGDYWNYWGPNEHGLYDGMFLNEEQWLKDVKYKDNGDILPRSGDDQLYFPGFVLNEAYANQQPVELDLEDKFETDLYMLQAENWQGWNPLDDKQYAYEPIMSRRQHNRFIPALPVPGKFKKDPDRPQGFASAFNNKVGLRPSTDSFRNPISIPAQRPNPLALNPNLAYNLEMQDAFLLPSYN